MKTDNEITVEVNTDLETLIKLIEKQWLILKETYDINDIYLINKSEKTDDYLSMLNKCVLIRDILEEKDKRKLLTYKHKEYNSKKEIIKQSEVTVKIDDIEKTKLLFENLNFEELIRINDHMHVYANDTDEFVIQIVNNKHIYIEIETWCRYANKTYNSIDEMKEVITKYSIPIKNNNYYAKKAEIELQETYK